MMPACQAGEGRTGGARLEANDGPCLDPFGFHLAPTAPAASQFAALWLRSLMRIAL